MKKLTIMMMTVCLCASTAIFAADGSWGVAAGGDWETTGNWVGNNIADGAGSVAYFTNIANSTITADTRTIGEIRTDNTAGFWLNNGPLTLDNSGSAPVIEVGVGVLYANCGFAGTAGFDKTGASWLLLYNTTVSGDINVNAGVLGLMWADSIMNADVKVNNGTQLLINNGVTANGKSVTVNNGGVIQPYIGTAGLNAPLTCNYPDAGNTFAVQCPAANDIISLNSNITMTANTVMAVDGNGSTININAPVSGAYQLRLMGRSATANIGVYNINAACTYTGNTVLESWGANPIFELGVNNALPCNGTVAEVILQVDNSSADTSVTLDLNDKTQKVNKLHFSIDGSQTGHEVIITGSDAAVLEVTNTFTTWESAPGVTVIKQTGGKIICNGPGCSLSSKMIISNATFLNNGGWWGGANGYFELQAGGKIGGTGFLGWEGNVSTNLVIPNGATITPGNSIGTVGCWNLEMQSGSEYDWEVDAGTADLVDVRGNLDISAGGITVNVIDAGSPDGDVLTLFTVAGTITGAGTDITMSYALGVVGPTNPTIDGGNITAAIIPEPGTIGLLTLLALSFLRRK